MKELIVEGKLENERIRVLPAPLSPKQHNDAGNYKVYHQAKKSIEKISG